MARTKKDLKNQAAAEEQMVGEGTALEGETLQQKPAGEQDGVPAGSLSDLELTHTGTLDPDAPQTEAEAEGMGEMPSDPAPEPNPEIENGFSGAPSPQTGSEFGQHGRLGYRGAALLYGAAGGRHACSGGGGCRPDWGDRPGRPRKRDETDGGCPPQIADAPPARSAGSVH